MINKALKTLWVYNGVFMVASGLFGPLYAVYVQKITGNIVVISLSWATFLISTTLCTFIVSKYGDSIKEKEYLLMAGFLIRAIVWFLYMFVGNVFFLIVLQICIGVGESLGSPAFSSLVAEHLDKGRHIEEYADMSMIFNLAAALATILGGFIVARYSFSVLFTIMSVLALISFFGILLKPRKLL